MSKKVCPPPPNDLLVRCLETIPRETLQTPMRPHLLLDISSKRRLWGLTVALTLPALLLLMFLPRLHGFRAKTPPIPTNPKIVAVDFTPVPCDIPKCEQRDCQGSIQIAFSDETKQAISGTSVYVDKDALTKPQVTPDGTMLGWLEGKHLDRQGLTYFLPRRLILQRGKQAPRMITGERGFIEAFQFWNGGKQVVYRTRGMHGVSDIVLYDLASGKRVSSIPGYAKLMPEWAAKLGD